MNKHANFYKRRSSNNISLVVIVYAFSHKNLYLNGLITNKVLFVKGMSSSIVITCYTCNYLTFTRNSSSNFPVNRNAKKVYSRERRCNSIEHDTLLYNDKEIFIKESEGKNTIESENKARLAEIASAWFVYVQMSCVYSTLYSVSVCL